MKKLIPQKLKNIYHLCRSFFAAAVFGFPARKLRVIGITGTNGKTTTVQMVAKIFQQAGKKTAVASTINFQIADRRWVNKTKFTTLSAWQTQKFIKQAINSNCEYLVLEVSSHSLDQNRVWGVGFDVAVVTNVTREHLDYHKTMEGYRAAKLKLFGMLKEEGTAVVNLEMEKPEEFLSAFEGKKIGYYLEITNDKTQITNEYETQSSKPLRQDLEGQENRDQNSKIKDELVTSYELRVVEAVDVESKMGGSSFTVDNTHFKLDLPGQFNIENALAAVCVGLSQGINLETCSKALAKISVIPGRMDQVRNAKGIKIFIDYALTPDSMEKLGELAINYKLQTTNSKVIWVFGSCGERDRGKRPIMGEIVARYADFAIVTNEDPYGEDPMQIIDEVFAGVSRGNKIENENAWKIFDRKEAIKKALDLAHRGDVVLITGKGAEETMAIGKMRIPWNDKKIVKEILQ